MTYKVNKPDKPDRPKTNPGDVWVLLAQGESVEIGDLIYTGHGVVSVKPPYVFVGGLKVLSDIDAKYQPLASSEPAANSARHRWYDPDAFG